MSLWIRSQDKYCLKKVDGVYINPNRPHVYYIQDFDNNVFAEYKTEKRALEILNDIQSKLFNSNRVIVQTKYPCKKEDQYKVQMDFQNLNEVPAIVHDISTSVTPMNQEGFIYEMPEK